MDKLPDMNWGGPGYAEYQGYCKKSKQETHTFGLQQVESNQLMDMFGKQFREQQNLLNNVLIPQLTQWAQNPPGFGMQALANMKSQLQDTIGGQFASQQKNLQQQFASQNMAGLGSGVEQATLAGLQQGAAGQLAGGLENINIANAQAQLQEQQFGMTGLAQADQLLGQMPQSGELLTQSLGQQFNMANVLNQQGTFWSNMLGGIAGMLGGPGAAQAIGGMYGGGAPGQSGGMIPVAGGGAMPAQAQAQSGGGAWGPTAWSNLQSIGGYLGLG